MAEEFPLPKIEGAIKELDVLNTGSAILNGVFDLAQLEATVAHMNAPWARPIDGRYFTVAIGPA
ncbi:hypothetical protein [Variovorax sp. J31P207]|uniref:hypothetical protein n=1 Tax=Variovorax sp. J31P207 TaxID=3053510 RepID=UPI00257668C0|nr:hypothetical protein [Variovorax sp. J31P207]MDM0066767.1 hypothetical protein [Variovorax sp. J31P207]